MSNTTITFTTTKDNADLLADLLFELAANLEDDGRGTSEASRLVIELAKVARKAGN